MVYCLLHRWLQIQQVFYLYAIFVKSENPEMSVFTFMVKYSFFPCVIKSDYKCLPKLCNAISTVFPMLQTMCRQTCSRDMRVTKWDVFTTQIFSQHVNEEERLHLQCILVTDV